MAVKKTKKPITLYVIRLVNNYGELSSYVYDEKNFKTYGKNLGQRAEIMKISFIPNLMVEPAKIVPVKED